jgi:hypothetical protein
VVRRQHFLTCAFAVRRLGGTLTRDTDPAVQDLRFVPLAELDRYLPHPSLGAPIRYWLAHPKESARYWFFPEYTAE